MISVGSGCFLRVGVKQLLSCESLNMRFISFTLFSKSLVNVICSNSLSTLDTHSRKFTLRCEAGFILHLKVVITGKWSDPTSPRTVHDSIKGLVCGSPMTKSKTLESPEELLQ